MSQSDAPMPEKPAKSRRLWFQYSLLTLLVLTVFVALWMASSSHSARGPQSKGINDTRDWTAEVGDEIQPLNPVFEDPLYDPIPQMLFDHTEDFDGIILGKKLSTRVLEVRKDCFVGLLRIRVEEVLKGNRAKAGEVLEIARFKWNFRGSMEGELQLDRGIFGLRALSEAAPVPYVLSWFNVPEGDNWEPVLQSFRTDIKAKGARDKVTAAAASAIDHSTAYKTAARTRVSPDASLTIEMPPLQPSTAPVILFAKITNISDRDLHGEFQQNIGFEAYLTGSDNKPRRVAVTNGSQIQGSYIPSVTLKPGASYRTPLRLSNYTAQERDYLPSEKVFLPAGKYQLRLVRILPGWVPPAAPKTAETTTSFVVTDDPAVGKARWDELKSPAKGDEAFATHVLTTTLTPEIRASWYAQILKDEPASTSFKVYALSVIEDPPADVVSAMLEIFRNQLDRYNAASREQSSILNNAAFFLGNHLPPGAGDAFLKCALSRNAPAADKWTRDALNGARTASFDALRDYWQDGMADKIVPALSSDEKWIPIYAARLLAWAGDDRGADLLIAAAKNKNSYAAGGLAYLPNNHAAAEVLKVSLASKDATFLKELRQVLAEQAPARGSKKSERGSF